MTDKDNCPKCGSSWIGEEIPKNIRCHYGGATHFKREIGIEDPKIYDGVSFIRCPDCKALFNRWTWQEIPPSERKQA